MKERGWELDVLLAGKAENLPRDAKTNYHRYAKIGTIRAYVDEDFCLTEKSYGPCALVVDALFGIGLNRPVSGFDNFGWTTQMSRWRDHSADYPNARVVAVDVPSGMSTDDGLYLRPDDIQYHEDIKAHLTVTFHRLKVCHVTPEGRTNCGKVVVKDIGL